MSAILNGKAGYKWLQHNRHQGLILAILLFKAFQNAMKLIKVHWRWRQRALIEHLNRKDPVVFAVKVQEFRLLGYGNFGHVMKQVDFVEMKIYNLNDWRTQ